MEKEGVGKAGLFLIISYLLLDYLRPQELVPPLAALHIPMLVQALIIFSLFAVGFARLKARESIFFFLLLCLMALHVPFARNNYAAFQVTRNMMLQFVVFLGIIGLLDTQKKLTLVTTCWIIVAMLCAVKGYFSGGKIPSASFLGDENDFALFLNMMIPLAFFAGRSARSRAAKGFFSFGIIVLILGTVSSMSRGGFLGMLPPLLYCWFKSSRKIVTAAVAAVIGLFLIIAIVPSEYWAEMKTIREEGTMSGTGEQRAYLWRHAFSMFRDHPLLGVGPGNYNWNLGLYEPPEGFKGRSHAGRPSHSIYFTLLPELGLAGTFLFLGLILMNQAEARRLNKTSIALEATTPKEQLQTLEDLKNRGTALTGALIAYLISGAFLSVLYYGHIWLVFAFSVANNRLLKQHIQQLQKQSVPQESDFYEYSHTGWQHTRSSGNYSIFG